MTAFTIVRLVVGTSLVSAGLILGLPRAIAQQPEPPAVPVLPPVEARPQSPDPVRPPAARLAPPLSARRPGDRHHPMERAWREIRKAEEEAYSVAYLSSQVSSPTTEALMPLAAELLSQAYSQYEAGQYFEAHELAKGAKDTYEAIETLYEGELGYVLSSSGQPSPSYYDAPYRIGEVLYRVESEIAYYSSNNRVAAELLRYAQELANPATTTSVPSAERDDLAYLTQNRAAVRLAEAASRVVRAEQGF